MTIPFSKYQGAGNDFIMIDQRNASTLPEFTTERIAQLCDRRFGIGADGLILLQNDSESDFLMQYYNSDGNESSMCGNGGRCIVAFAKEVGCIHANETIFNAIDGLHEAVLYDGNIVDLKMSDVKKVEKIDKFAFRLDTGSPHFVKFVEEIPSDVKSEGSAIRYSQPYRTIGINVNFVKRDGNSLRIATYERGVEDETLACGTGVTAAAITSLANLSNGTFSLNVYAKGGKLTVRFTKHGDQNYSDIWLKGEAKKVFSGLVDLNLLDTSFSSQFSNHE
ncbi:MAG: diaminopimelate epimerase [Saprospiraceae bacterium]